jgi:hypothetical protein
VTVSHLLPGFWHRGCVTGGDSDHHQVAARAIKDHHHDDDDSDGRDPAGCPRQGSQDLRKFKNHI